jgi:hypothetical protein
MDFIVRVKNGISLVCVKTCCFYILTAEEKLLKKKDIHTCTKKVPKIKHMRSLNYIEFAKKSVLLNY